MEIICLTNDQTRHICKKVESESAVNADTIKQEIEEDTLDRNNVEGDELNPYHEIITNNIDRENIITSQMEQWSRLSNIVHYAQYYRHPKNSFMI